jgi:sensor histidine kinase YesM
MRIRQLNLFRDNLLPVIFSSVVPGIGYLVTGDNGLKDINIIVSWIYTSFILFLLWNLLSVSWRIKVYIKKIAFLILSIPVFFFLVLFTSNTLGFKESFELEFQEIFRMIMIIIIILTSQYTRESSRRIKKLELEKEQIEKETYKVKLQSLRNQMDPHFFFNSLNTLHAMIQQSHINSKDFVISLSDYYRSTLNINESVTQPLSKEMSFLKSYLQLMKYRIEKGVIIDLDYFDKEFESFHIPTLSLQSVLENCFKHNTITSKNPMRISIKTIEGGFLEITNTVHKKLITPNSPGTGLTLLSDRYKLLGVSNGLEVEKTESIFSVKLKLISRK